MNWFYITGFLDADGSISYMRKNENKRRTPQVSFHNNEEVILKRIRDFIKEELGVNGRVVKKKARKETHLDSYDLRYYYKSAIEILKRVDPIHPKKRHRKNILIKIHKLVPRNGKYSDQVLSKIERLEQRYK